MIQSNHRDIPATELDERLLAVMQEVIPDACMGHFSDYMQTGHDQLLLIQPAGEHQGDQNNPRDDLIAVRYVLVAAVNISQVEYAAGLKHLRELTKAIRKKLRNGVLTPNDRPRPTFDQGRPEGGQWLVAEALISINIVEKD